MKFKAIGLTLLAYLLTASASFAAIPQPLVNLDASGLTAGGNFTDWPNTGTLGGNFNVKLGTTPSTVTTVAGKKAVSFDGNNGLQTNTTTTLITGKAPFTAAMWVYNPAIADTEVCFQWGKRGSNNRSGHLNYGGHASSGAVGGWGENGDMPYTGGVPAAAAWHHIAVTYDTMIERLYVDGVLQLAEGKVQDTAYSPFTVGRTFETGVVGLSGSIASVKLYAAALSDADIVSLYTSEGGTAPAGAPGSPTVLNSSFESPAYTTVDKVLNSNSYVLRDWWTNSEGSTGLTRKGTTSTNWYGSTMTTTTQGSQIFLLSNDDNRREVKQLVKGFKARKAYTVSVLTSARVGSYNKPPVMIDINGQGLLATPQIVNLATGGTAWTTVTSAPWVCPADGAYWVCIHTTQGNLNMGPGNYNTSLLLDGVQITTATTPALEMMVASPAGGQSWGVLTSTDASSIKNIVVTNLGTAAVNVTDVVINGSSKFTLGTVAPGKTASIAAGGTLTIPVTFNPASAAVGVYTATVAVTTNDAVTPIKNYSVTAAVQASAAGKRTILIDDTGVSLGYNDATGFGQFGTTTALRDANLALNALATTATTDMMIVDGNGLPYTYAADFTVRQPAVTIRQVANGQNNDSTITLASDGSQTDSIVKVCERDCTIQGLSASRKLVLIDRFPLKGMMIGVSGLNSTFSPGLAARNFVLQDFKFRGYGDATVSYSPNPTYNRVDWEMTSGEGPRLTNASSTLYPLATATYSTCTAFFGTQQTVRYFLPVENRFTAAVWNNCLISHTHPTNDYGSVHWGNEGTAATGGQATYTWNNCTFDYRNSTQPLMSGWTVPNGTAIFNNPTFIGPMASGAGALISLQEDKNMIVKITGTPSKKVDLTGLRTGVNLKTVIRHNQSAITLTDCIIDDQIDITGGRRGYPYWNASTTLDRCMVMAMVGYNANNKIKHTVTATSSIFKTSAETTTSLFLASGDSTSTANITNCTFLSTNSADTTASAAFLYADAGTAMTMNYTLVKGPKPVNNQGILTGDRNLVSFGAVVKGTNNLTNTITDSPGIDNTGRITNTLSKANGAAIGSTVLLDYDGEPRGTGGPGQPQPDIGADETNLVPVELSTFSVE